MEFMPNVMDSCNANTCFLFDLQASFGLAVGWMLAFLLLCSLDCMLLFFRPLTPGMLIACMSTFLLCTVSLLSAAFSVCLISHGIAVSAGLAVMYGFCFRSSQAYGDCPDRLRWRAQTRASWQRT
jgi:hypothetical protein